jgi:hypothetical protein
MTGRRHPPQGRHRAPACRKAACRPVVWGVRSAAGSTRRSCLAIGGTSFPRRSAARDERRGSRAGVAVRSTQYVSWSGDVSAGGTPGFAGGLENKGRTTAGVLLIERQIERRAEEVLADQWSQFLREAPEQCVAAIVRAQRLGDTNKPRIARRRRIGIELAHHARSRSDARSRSWSPRASSDTP